jgi:hypothetical protein
MFAKRDRKEKIEDRERELNAGTSRERKKFF